MESQDKFFKTTYQGQITSKKNSRLISRNNRTGRFFSRMSDRAKTQENAMIFEFRNDFARQGFKAGEFENLAVEIYIRIWNQDRRRHDLDNQVSTILDALVKAEVLPDDKQEVVQTILVEYSGVDKDNPRAEIFINGSEEKSLEFLETKIKGEIE